MRLYDSKAQVLRDFTPIIAGKVGLYVCGPTVQSSPHIGHLRCALVYDQWRRWLTYRGYDVTFVRNVTDIDDKILVNVQDTTEQWWALAYRYELEFTAGYQRLGILAPTYEPRATASIQQMQELIGRLIERGHAYPAADGSGDVYFDTKSWSRYGELTRQSADNMEAAPDAGPRGKRDARDFALWKGTRRASRSRPPGHRRGATAAPAGTSSARRWPRGTSAPSSTSTAADSTCASRTTRTSSPSRPRPATRSRTTGCTTAS